MFEQKKTRPAQQERAENLLHSESTTDQPQMQSPIASLLRRGAENAIPTRELVALSGLRTARQLQKAIEAERAAGALILSAATGGYYLPADGEAGRAELLRYAGTLRSRAISTLRTLKTARRALRELDGQLRMDGGRD